MTLRLGGFLDVRPDERRIAALAFATLLLILGGHTVLETARDALLLTRLPPRAIGIVYLAVALCALPASTLAARASERFGPRASLIGTMFIASTVVMVLFALPTKRVGVLALYVVSGLIGSIAVPQFWTLLAGAFTVGQGRRLIGPVASAGVLGGVLGSGAAALVLPAIHIKVLLPISVVAFLGAAGVLFFVRTPRRSSPPALPQFKGSVRLLRQEPFLIRVAVVVALSAATLLAIDYFFKWTVIRTVPAAQVGVFVARYYALLNGVSLIAQLFLANAIVRRLGVAGSVMVTPLILLIGAASSFALGGPVLLVLLVKAADDTLRNSVHRTTIEVLYLPVRSDLRQRAKPFIDGALGRSAQAMTAVCLLALGSASALSPRVFGAIVLA
ncbi:MAG: hypothetical protein M3O46_18270, partial [Myxococcota bacterium]|nr:hypothetical protein [Myxococcota bacterium]